MDNRISAAALFYSEDMRIPIKEATRVAHFIELSRTSSAVEKSSPWAMGGKIRVYLEVWSQNSMRPYCMGEKWYYDATESDIFASGMFYGRMHVARLSSVANMGRSNFSGAKTRARIIELSRAFYEQKTDWG